MNIQPGMRVRQKSGGLWSGKYEWVTVDYVKGTGAFGVQVYAKETGTWLSHNELEFKNPLTKEDLLK